ncbi:MAG: DUF6691 family protein [Leptothrix ochracea]|uniref:DUF6691 family protein n=2 Tax=Leptothrix ochracea TaxID=735331 RepID=UPI0034E1F2E4
MNLLLALLSGLIFGIGLIAGGMTNPLKIQNFLDLFGTWDPSLGFVMSGAIAVGVFAFAAAKRRERSWTGEHIELPTNRTIDTRLILGGVLFGAGWGLGGFCPGPALVAMSSGVSSALYFIIAMLAGMVIHDRWLQR